MKKYYLYEGGTLIVPTTVPKPENKDDVQQWVTNYLHRTPGKFPLSKKVQEQLAKAGLKDWDEVPVDDFICMVVTSDEYDNLFN